MCSTAESDACFPCLPSEIVQMIFKNLTMRDICTAAQASKSLWNITCQLSSLELFLHEAAPIPTTAESFLLFVKRRACKGLKVHRLSIHFVSVESQTLEAVRALLLHLAGIVACCSATLHHLSLSIFLPAKDDSSLRAAVADFSKLLCAVCECKELKALTIRAKRYAKGFPIVSDLFRRFVAALPELKVLLLMEGTGTGEAIYEVVRGDIIAKVATNPEAGLQLLMINIADTAKDYALPKSLRCLFLSHRCNRRPDHIYKLLGSLSNLEELYSTGFRDGHFALWKANASLPHKFEKLRIAVVDNSFGFTFSNAHVEVSTAVLPSLELLAVPSILFNPFPEFGAHVHAPVKLRCPNLKEFIFHCQSKTDISLLEYLLSGGAPQLEIVQVAVFYEGSPPTLLDLCLLLWRAVKGSSSLRNLKIIFHNPDMRSFDQHVLEAIAGASLVEGMRLPSLETLELYYFTRKAEGCGATVKLGSHLAYGARAVCQKIGKLVAAGALPSLKQVNLHPGSDEAGNAIVGPGPLLEDAKHVKSFFLPQPDGWQDKNLTWIRPGFLNAELQSRILAALTSIRTEHVHHRPMTIKNVR